MDDEYSILSEFFPEQYALSMRQSARSVAFEVSSSTTIVDIVELLKMELPTRDVLLEPWLQSQSLNMIHAWRGVGKTHLALGIAYALSIGGEFLGWTAKRPVPVLYVDGEMPATALQARLATIARNAEKGAVSGFFKIMTPDLQANGIMPDLATVEGQEVIESIIGDAKVIFIDNISCLVRTGRENESESWQPVADWALQMRAKGRSVVFIHHSGKGGGQRGTSKREDILDVVIALKHPSNYQPSDGARFEIHFEKCRALFGSAVESMEAHLKSSSDGSQRWSITDGGAHARNKVIELANAGLSQAEIGRQLGVHRATILRMLERAAGKGLYKPKIKSPKPKDQK